MAATSDRLSQGHHHHQGHQQELEQGTRAARAAQERRCGHDHAAHAAAPAATDITMTSLYVTGHTHYPTMCVCIPSPASLFHIKCHCGFLITCSCKNMFIPSIPIKIFPNLWCCTPPPLGPLPSSGNVVSPLITVCCFVPLPCVTCSQPPHVAASFSNTTLFLLTVHILLCFPATNRGPNIPHPLQVPLSSTTMYSCISYHHLLLVPHQQVYLSPTTICFLFSPLPCPLLTCVPCSSPSHVAMSSPTTCCGVPYYHLLLCPILPHTVCSHHHVLPVTHSHVLLVPYYLVLLCPPPPSATVPSKPTPTTVVPPPALSTTVSTISTVSHPHPTKYCCFPPPSTCVSPPSYHCSPPPSATVP